MVFAWCRRRSAFNRVNVDKPRAIKSVIAQHQIGLQGDDIPSDTFKIVLQIIRFRAGIDDLNGSIALQARLDQLSQHVRPWKIVTSNGGAECW